ncbi:hypothetical protein P43SY_004799 [Pythium insidiosum]|uniref:Selenoprotein W-like protein n=1 Tax=Pythium insidiosum TaxID=114742 RepID=A0AAD5M7H8_PYTIN|nr:hypothetical protein P43SY_004799 [Pythium insidiosum]
MAPTSSPALYSALQLLALATTVVIARTVSRQRQRRQQLDAAAASKRKMTTTTAPVAGAPSAFDARRHSLSAVADAEQDTPVFIVEIEYCTGCRWMLRAAWLAQELLTTFQTDASSRLRSVLLTPNSRQGGVFQVYLHATDGTVDRELLWSRKAVGRFPESKELKQILRDHICPSKELGHSDKK